MRSLLTLAFLAMLILPQVAEAGSSDNLSGWAWSSTIGWVSFNSTTGGGANHGVNVSASGAMSGYAWSPNVGWISFNSSDLSGCPSGSCQASFDKQTGAVSGWARALAGAGSSIQTGGWGGWIQLSGSSYAVTASGCQWSGYAWGGGPSLDSGVIGWLSFSGPGYGVTGSGQACAGGTKNLTASGVTPTTADPGVAKTYTGTVTNSGPAATGGSFSALFQRATDSSGSNAVDLGAVTIGNLTPGGTSAASISATLSAGTWYMRVCADKASSGDAGLITESSEVDNCGAWTAVSVGATSAAVSCNVNSTSVPVGGSVTYTATPSGGATSPYIWTAPDGGGFGSGSTATRTFSSAGTYGMSVQATPTSASATCPYVTVTSPAACTGTVTATLTANPSRVRSGSPTTLTWNAGGVNTSCTVTGTGGFTQTTTATSCTVPTTVVTRTIATQSTYSISCDGGPVLDSITVNVIPNFQEF